MATLVLLSFLSSSSTDKHFTQWEIARWLRKKVSQTKTESIRPSGRPPSLYIGCVGHAVVGSAREKLLPVCAIGLLARRSPRPKTVFISLLHQALLSPPFPSHYSFLHTTSITMSVSLCILAFFNVTFTCFTLFTYTFLSILETNHLRE